MVRRPFSALALGLVLSASCRERAEPRKQPQRAPAPSASASASMPAALASSLAEIHARTRVSAPAWRTQRVAFGKRVLVALDHDSGRVLDLTELSEQRLPLAGPRAVVELAGGTVLIAAERETLELGQPGKAPARLARLPLFPGAELWPERRDPRKVWVLQRPTRLLVRHVLSAEAEGLLPAELVVTLESYNGSAFAVLRDGALLYATEHGLERRLAEGKPRRLSSPAASLPWRLVAAARVDQAFSIGAGGEIALLQVQDRLRTVRRFDALDSPLDAAASELHVALLLVREGKPEREIWVRVWTKNGERVFDVLLESVQAAPDDDWSERFTRRAIAVNDDPPLVAVASPERLDVWNHATRDRVYPR